VNGKVSRNKKLAGEDAEKNEPKTTKTTILRA
jgi:hypothetical protein